MTIINTIGGLGNQMFQYAFAFAFSQKHNQQIKLDITGFKKDKLRDYQLDLFNVNIVLATEKEALNLKYKKRNIFIRTFRKPKKWGFASSYYLEPHFHFDSQALHIKNDVYFEGYWQSEKYFKNHKDELLKQFTLKAPFSQKAQQYQQKIAQVESVSLHIRRGDYTSKKNNRVQGFCGLYYYQQAMLKITEQTKNPHFFIFSDDLDWAKNNLDFFNKKTFVELEKTAPDHEEILLMSECQHNIIANSSFSWWGAWLNQNPNKQVIAPKKWFNDSNKDAKDLIPTKWVCL